ncbi:MAG: geranylgeranyl reductase family protein [Ferruginibacter sp.]
MSRTNFDVIIVGAGPSGTACAIKLADSGLNVALLDKASFPRDKTCGDALSVDVINQLPMLADGLVAEFEALENKIPSYGVKIFSPDHNYVDIPFIHKNEKSCGYISPRMNFDNLLFQHAKQYSNIHIFENCGVNTVAVKKENVEIETSLGTFSAEMVIGADGAHSVVAKQLADIKVEKEHYSAGLRVYYEGVADFHAENYIELHFFKSTLPCYLWVFPLAENKANVGIGMLSSIVSKKKLNLKEILQDLLKTHPHLKARFENAKPLETIKGYGLPLGSKKRNISGERFLLTGDAAALIDPFTGEGIANALRSGRVAAAHSIACFEQRNFSAAFNKQYDKEIYHRMWKEFKISSTLQRLVSYPRLFNFVIRKARQSKYMQKVLIDALANIEKKKKILLRPAFYFRMLFK